MTDMVERVAKAIYEREGYVYCDDAGMFQPVAWDKLDSDDCQVSRDGYRRMARAAIAAMREPTEEMLEAFHRDAHFEPENGVQIKCTTVDDAYRAMIDAALGGKDDTA